MKKYKFECTVEFSIESSLPLTDDAATQRAESVVRDALVIATKVTKSPFIGTPYDGYIEVTDANAELIDTTDVPRYE